jgi:TPR repeat protein
MLPAPSPDALLAQGDRHLFGEGDCLQDLAEACRCYRLAATRGSLVALERLGAIYAQVKGRGRGGRRRALRQLKDGALRGNYYCYVELAAIFTADGHFQNVAKAWDTFFCRRADSFRPDIESGNDRYILALRRYIASSLDQGIMPKHMAELQNEAEALVRSMLASLDDLRDAPEARQRLAAILRWTYDTLLPASTEMSPQSRPRAWLNALVVRARGVTA